MQSMFRTVAVFPAVVRVYPGLPTPSFTRLVFHRYLTGRVRWPRLLTLPMISTLCQPKRNWTNSKSMRFTFSLWLLPGDHSSQLLPFESSIFILTSDIFVIRKKIWILLQICLYNVQIKVQILRYFPTFIIEFIECTSVQQSYCLLCCNISK